MGEKDERGEALFANVEWLWVSFSKISIFPSYPSDINRTAYIAGWQAHHHHQLGFYKSRDTTGKVGLCDLTARYCWKDL